MQWSYCSLPQSHLYDLSLSLSDNPFSSPGLGCTAPRWIPYSLTWTLPPASRAVQPPPVARPPLPAPPAARRPSTPCLGWGAAQAVASVTPHRLWGWAPLLPRERGHYRPCQEWMRSVRVTSLLWVPYWWLRAKLQYDGLVQERCNSVR